MKIALMVVAILALLAFIGWLLKEFFGQISMCLTEQDDQKPVDKSVGGEWGHDAHAWEDPDLR